jgi:hypothetical protein
MWTPTGPTQYGTAAVFIFLYFLFSFFIKNIFSIWKFTGIYPGRSAAGRPGRQGHL